MKTYPEFYSQIAKPFFAPPPWLFGLVWGIIYPLITVTFVYLCILVIREKVPKKLLWIFLINLIANFIFTPVQLGLSALWPASIDIFVVFVTLAYFEWKIWSYSKIIFFLLLPYLLWGAFATILQFSITIIN